MKHFWILLVFAAIGLAFSGDAPKVLIFLRPGSGDLEFMLNKEVLVMANALERSGFKVVYATIDGSPMSAGKAMVKADLKLADAKAADYAGLMLPCLMVASYPEPEIAPETMNLVKSFVAAGKPVAAQTGSLWTLAKSGVLKGKKYAYAFAEKHKYFEGAVFGGTGVVRDGLIVTAGMCPHMARTMKVEDTSEPLALALAAAIKESR